METMKDMKPCEREFLRAFDQLWSPLSEIGTALPALHNCTGFVLVQFGTFAYFMVQSKVSGTFRSIFRLDRG